MRTPSPVIPKKYRKRILREHAGLGAQPKPFWQWPWGRYLQPDCSCGWKGDLVGAMPVEFPMSSQDLAIMQMDQHVTEVLRGYELERKRR